MTAPPPTPPQVHLEGCPHCWHELQQLREVDTALRGLPPELFLDGPPQGRELALERAMRQVRDEKTRRSEQGRRGSHRGLLIAAAALVLAVVGGGSWVLGQQTGLTELTGQALPAGTHVAASSATTGAQLTAVITPAVGWVRLTATVTGIPAGEQCNLIVVD